MKFLILVFNFLLWHTNQAQALEVCTHQVSKGSYQFVIDENICRNHRSCWISFRPPEDVFTISINDSEVVNMQMEQYTSNEQIFIPLKLKNSDSFEIYAEDTNQNLTFPNTLCVNIGRYSEIRWKNAISWFFNTGVTIFSAYFLLIVSFFIILSLWLRRSPLGFSLLAYSIASIFYLLSFSEYTRAIFNPILATGGFHFPLRLGQDALLVLVFYHFHQKVDSYQIIKKLIYLYAIVIGIYILLLTIGIDDYIYYKRIIIIMAPLVAMPMAIGFIFALRSTDKFEKKVLLPTSLALLCFQINDLLVFWGIIRSYFTVKFYIPMIVCMCLFMYMRRIYLQSKFFEINKERSRVLDVFLHDIKSPIAVLRVFVAKNFLNHEQSKVMRNAIDRIEAMISEISPKRENENFGIYPLTSCLVSVIEEKKVEFPDILIRNNISEEIFAYGSRTSMERVFSNIINNSVDASIKKSKLCEISFDAMYDDRLSIIKIRDNGPGIEAAILKNLLTRSTTTKHNGKGIGISSAKEYLNSVSGEIEVLSKKDIGTTVLIKNKTVQSPNWFFKTFDVSNLEVIKTINYEHFSKTLKESIGPTAIEIDFSLSSRDLEIELSKLPARENLVALKYSGLINSGLQKVLDDKSNIIIVQNITQDHREIDYVLIDDDRFIRLAWEYNARSLGKTIKTFPDVPSFLKECETIDNQVRIYLDLNINGDHSTKYIDSFSKLGFNNIFLATGEEIPKENLPSNIRGVFGKLPPLQ